MVEIHESYDGGRFEKLRAAFRGDPRQGNHALYIREHFDLRRICGACDSRTTAKYADFASVVIEGSSWVLPISIQADGTIIVDLEASIPDQSNLLSDQAVLELQDVGIICRPQGRIEYIVPLAPDRESYYRQIPKKKYWEYKNTRRYFACEVITDASADDVLKWDTEVEYDWEAYLTVKRDEPGRCGFNVETEYFQWLAENGRLVLARISDEKGDTMALCYCVPGDYLLHVVNYKRRTAERYSPYSFGKTLIYMLIDHIYENGLLTPLNIGKDMYHYKEIWQPIPGGSKPQLAFEDRAALESIARRLREKQ